MQIYSSMHTLLISMGTQFFIWETLNLASDCLDILHLPFSSSILTNPSVLTGHLLCVVTVLSYYLYYFIEYLPKPCETGDFFPLHFTNEGTKKKTAWVTCNTVSKCYSWKVNLTPELGTKTLQHIAFKQMRLFL